MKKRNKIDSIDEISNLMFILMQPSIAGGMPISDVDKMYQTMLKYICNLNEPVIQLDTLIESIISRWAVPLLKEKGIKIKYHNPK